VGEDHGESGAAHAASAVSERRAIAAAPAGDAGAEVVALIAAAESAGQGS
jgi:hypothetical protein